MKTLTLPLICLLFGITAFANSFENSKRDDVLKETTFSYPCHFIFQDGVTGELYEYDFSGTVDSKEGCEGMMTATKIYLEVNEGFVQP